MKLRFHLDESISTAVRRGLALRLIDATTSSSAGLDETSDETQLQFATNEGRALVTLDADFLAIAKSFDNHAGIVYCHPARSSIGTLVVGIAKFCRSQTSEDMIGSIRFL